MKDYSCRADCRAYHWNTFHVEKEYSGKYNLEESAKYLENLNDDLRQKAVEEIKEFTNRFVKN